MIAKFIGALIFASSLFLLFQVEKTGLITEFQIFFWPAIVVTLIGPLGLLLLSTDSEQLKSTTQFLFRDSLTGARKKLDHEYFQLKKLGIEYYSRGVRVFDIKDPQLSEPICKMLERLSIRVPLVDAYDLLERDRDQICARLEQSISLTILGGRLGPSVGMLGTIIGMSQLLSHLKEPENIGPSMSVALLTTFYGLFFSLALWTPLTNHLNRLLDLKLRSFEQALHWLDLMQKRKPADYLGDSFGNGREPQREGGKAKDGENGKNKGSYKADSSGMINQPEAILLKEFAMKTRGRSSRRRQLSVASGASESEFIWLMSLSDLMMLLFVFFVVLFSFASKKLTASDYYRIKNAFGKKSEAHVTPIDAIQQNLLKWVVNRKLLDSIDLQTKDDALVIEIKEKLLFNSGAASLKPEALDILPYLREALGKIPAPYRVGIEGHTDDTPVSGSSDNWHLSIDRALMVKDALHLPPDLENRIVIMGFGSTRPLEPNRDAKGVAIVENQAKNRRVTIRIF